MVFILLVSDIIKWTVLGIVLKCLPQTTECSLFFGSGAAYRHRFWKTFSGETILIIFRRQCVQYCPSTALPVLTTHRVLFCPDQC
jgi:hypothetical protein